MLASTILQVVQCWQPLNPTWALRTNAGDKVCGCVMPRERDPILYNRTYVDRLDKWRKDDDNDRLMGPSAVDVAGTKALLEASGACGGRRASCLG